MQNIVEVIKQFSSLKVPAALLLTQLPRLQPVSYLVTWSGKTRVAYFAKINSWYYEYFVKHACDVSLILLEYTNIFINLLTVFILCQRFYSISSSPQAHPGEIHATIAVVRFKKESKLLSG